MTEHGHEHAVTIGIYKDEDGGGGGGGHVQRHMQIPFSTYRYQLQQQKNTLCLCQLKKKRKKKWCTHMHRKKPQENKASTIVECGLGQNGKHNVKDNRKGNLWTNSKNKARPQNNLNKNFCV